MIKEAERDAPAHRHTHSDRWRNMFFLWDQLLKEIHVRIIDLCHDIVS